MRDSSLIHSLPPGGIEINLPLTQPISCGIHKGLQPSEASDWSFLLVMEGRGNVAIWNTAFRGVPHGEESVDDTHCRETGGNGPQDLLVQHTQPQAV